MCGPQAQVHVRGRRDLVPLDALERDLTEHVTRPRWAEVEEFAGVNRPVAEQLHLFSGQRVHVAAHLHRVAHIPVLGLPSTALELLARLHEQRVTLPHQAQPRSSPIPTVPGNAEPCAPIRFAMSSSVNQRFPEATFARVEYP